MKKWLKNEVNLENMTLKLQKWPKTSKQHKMKKKMHYEITIFGAYAPSPRLIYWIVSSIPQGKKDDISSKSGPCSSHTPKIHFSPHKFSLVINTQRTNKQTNKNKLNKVKKYLICWWKNVKVFFFQLGVHLWIKFVSHALIILEN